MNEISPIYTTINCYWRKRKRAVCYNGIFYNAFLEWNKWMNLTFWKSAEKRSRFCGLRYERNFKLNVLEMFDKWLKHATLRLAIISQWSIRSQVGDSGKSRPLILGRFLRVGPYAWNSPLRHILDIEKFESAGLSHQVRNEWKMNVWESIFRRVLSSNSDNYRSIK